MKTGIHSAALEPDRPRFHPLEHESAKAAFDPFPAAPVILLSPRLQTVAPAVLSGVGENRQRLDELLRRRRRATLVPRAIEAWAALGVTASPLSADRQAALVAQLRASGFRQSCELPEASSSPLSKDIDDFAELNDLLIIIGWDIDEEPAVLLPAEAVSRCVTNLRSLYPDGFVMLGQPTTEALVIDFDEVVASAVYVDRRYLPPTE